MSFNALEWVAAVGGVAAAAGAWRTEAAARWQARAERLRTDKARREKDLHQARFLQLYHWWNDMPDSPERRAAMDFFAEWTGARDPGRAGEPGPLPPGFGSADSDDAYRSYVRTLDDQFGPGRAGAPRAIRPPEPAGDKELTP
jgi:hypothetical protein